MDGTCEKIFATKAVDFGKLAKYGFVREGENYVFRTEICESQMRLTVKIDGKGKTETAVFDLDSQDVYTLHLVESAEGSFVGRVREEYERVLCDIADKCFFREAFHSDAAKSAISYVREKYGGELEFLWDDLPKAAIWRRADNRKWYGVLMAVSARKIGLDSDDFLEILCVKARPEEIASLIDGRNYFYAYHMNKKHWITVNFNGSLSSEEIAARIDFSYLAAK